MIRKSLTFLIVAGLLIAVGGCGPTRTPEPTTASTEAPPTEAPATAAPSPQPAATLAPTEPAVPTEVAPGGETEMRPFTDETLAVTGLAPAGWQTSAAAPGVYSRASEPNDLVRLIQQAAPGSTKAELAAALLPQLGLEALPEPSDSLSSPSFEWDVYYIAIEVPGYGAVVVNLALTETPEAAYIVLLQAPLAEAENLNKAVFLPAVKALAPLGESSVGDGDVEAVYRHPDGLFTAPIPTNWTVEEAEAYATLSSPDGEAVVHLLVVEASDLVEGIAAAWAIVDPEFDLEPDQIIDEPNPEGVERTVSIVYDTGDENDFVVAGGWLHDGLAYVEVFVTDLEGYQKRATQLQIISTGYTITALDQIDLSAVEPLALDDDLIAALEGYIQDKMVELDVPGAEVALVQDGEVVYSRGFGVRDRETGEPVTPETLMMIGSTTKSMTTLLMAQLVDAGLFDWDTPVVEILPSFEVADPEVTAQITMRNLVCACTGVPRRDFEWLFNARDLTAEDIIESLADFEFFTEFGEAFQYSNQMVASGGYIATLPAGGIYGQLYEDFVSLFQERVLDPIGMSHSTFSFDEVVTGSNYATPYGQTPAGEMIALPLSDEAVLVPMGPAGALWSNAADMANYLITELNDGLTPDGARVVSAENLAVTWEPQVDITADASYGLGWIVEDYKGVRVISHGGNTFGFTSELAFLPDHDLGISILSNQQNSALNQVVRFRLLELVYGQEFEIEETLQFQLGLIAEARAELLASLQDPLDAAAVEPYLGDYTNDALGVATLGWRDDALVLDVGEFQTEIRAQVKEDGLGAGADPAEIQYFTWEPPIAGVPLDLTEGDDGQPQLVFGLGVVEYVFEKLP